MTKGINQDKKDIRICKRCKHFFEYHNIGYGYCPQCTQIDNEIFERVRTFILENGTATAKEISEACEVSELIIYQYLRDGRIEIPNNSPIFIKCEKCHTDIRYGRFCLECATEMKKSMNKGVAIENYAIGEKPKTIKFQGKMHTFENTKHRNE